jgi:hypothetical protein
LSEDSGLKIPGVYIDSLGKSVTTDISKISKKIEIDKYYPPQPAQKEQVYIYKTSLIADYQKLREIIG